VGLVAAGFLAPDAHAERAARRHRARLAAALPDALDLLAVGAAAGRAPARLFGEIAGGTEGALATELAITLAEIETGSPVAAALERLRDRTGASELGALAAALDRSRRYGSPLADQLHAQAAALRREERRRVEEVAARAAPQIQLVVALVLVPSALLTIAAALIAHSDALFGAW
jgi:tight adherence protein C